MTTTQTATVASADGSRITYDRKGDGPAVILVSAVLGTRAFDPLYEGLVEQLSDRFAVYRYDRRGRGDSTDTAPYAVEREIEDIAALIAAAGGQASLYGLSSGAVLALRAAEALPQVTRLALYEPPFITDDSRPPLPDDYVEQLERAVAEGRRGDAVEILMTQAVGVPAEYIGPMKADPSWAFMEAVAHTISHDGRIIGTTMSGRPLPEEWAKITTPTLVVVGGVSEPFFQRSTRELAELLPNAEHRVLEGQSHDVDAAVLAPLLAEFFGRR
jgi:pimeloyl-ACP methyl ester carboxylesterase